MSLQGSIKNLTKDGHAIAQFLVDTMQGTPNDAKIHHRLDAAKQLIKFGFDNSQHNQSFGLIPTPEELTLEDKTENPSDPPNSTTSNHVSFLDIINYDIARQIRSETAEGHTIVEFLVDAINDIQKPFTPKHQRFTPADRMAAAKELLRRGFGDFNSSRPKLTENRDDYHTLHSDLAKRMREYSDNGADAVRFLLEVMTEQDPESGFTTHHRISAARELLQRGWDINFDAVTWKQVEDYWRDQESTRLSVGQKKTLAGLSAFVDEFDIYDNVNYEAIAKQLRENDYADSIALATSKDDRTESTKQAEQHKPVAEPDYANCGPSDPDPTVDYFYEPLSPEEQAKFDEELRREYAAAVIDENDNQDEHDEEYESWLSQPQRKGYSDPMQQLEEAIAVHGSAAICAPNASSLRKAAIRSP